MPFRSDLRQLILLHREWRKAIWISIVGVGIFSFLIGWNLRPMLDKDLMVIEHRQEGEQTLYVSVDKDGRMHQRLGVPNTPPLGVPNTPPIVSPNTPRGMSGNTPK